MPSYPSGLQPLPSLFCPSPVFSSLSSDLCLSPDLSGLLLFAPIWLLHGGEYCCGVVAGSQPSVLWSQHNENPLQKMVVQVMLRLV